MECISWVNRHVQDFTSWVNYFIPVNLFSCFSMCWKYCLTCFTSFFFSCLPLHQICSTLNLLLQGLWQLLQELGRALLSEIWMCSRGMVWFPAALVMGSNCRGREMGQVQLCSRNVTPCSLVALAHVLSSPCFANHEDFGCCMWLPLEHDTFLRNA